MAATQAQPPLDEPQAQAQLAAYNAAFDELQLNWSWDAATYRALRAPGPHAVRAYLEREQSHLLRAYDADFIVRAIEGTKERCHALMVAHRSATSTQAAGTAR